MSSILKALEKAEESNSTKRQPGESNLIRSRRSRPTWVLPAAVLCGACAATLVTFAAMGGFSRRAPAAPAPVPVTKADPVLVVPLKPVIETPAPVPRQTAPVTPAGAPSLNPRAVPAPSPKNAPLSTPAEAPGLLDQKSAARVNSKEASPGIPEVTRSPVGKARVAAKAASPRSAQPAVVQAAPAPRVPLPETAVTVPTAPSLPVLKVSGIAWQGKGESSFAVVNGRAVLQGATVDGFKVLEIQKDMVRFSGSNGNVDVPLGADEK